MSSGEIKDSYVGPYKIVGIVEQDFKTPLGGEVIKVIYVDRPNEIMPKKAYDLLLSKEPVDHNATQQKRWEMIIPKLIEQLAEYDVRMSELGSLFSKTHQTITDHFERASSYLWTGDDDNWICGMNFMNNRTLVETHKELLKMKKGSRITDITNEPETNDKG